MTLMKYPRTPHLPWSEGLQDDDRRIESLDLLRKGDVVVTHKLDGENTTLMRDGLHARSLTYADHPSRSWIKALHARIRHEIPDGLRVHGENVYARHSIAYHDLPSFFLVFGISHVGLSHELQNVFFSWAETLVWCELLGLTPVPTLYGGAWDEARIKACYTGTSPFGEQEGYVVRLARPIRFDDFGLSVAKFVRANHVQTDEHWMRQPVIPNQLLPGKE